MWQPIWLLLHMQCVTLFALDVLVALTIFALWASYVIASLTPRALVERDPAAVDVEVRQPGHRGGERDGVLRRLGRRRGGRAHARGGGRGGDGDGLAHSPILLQCVLLSVAWLLVVLLAVRRLNRFERQSFVNRTC